MGTPIEPPQSEERGQTSNLKGGGGEPEDEEVADEGSSKDPELADDFGSSDSEASNKDAAESMPPKGADPRLWGVLESQAYYNDGVSLNNKGNVKRSIQKEPRILHRELQSVPEQH